jgi:hypothetical protein
MSPSCPIVELDSFTRDCVAAAGEDDLYIKGAGSVFVTVGTAGADLYDLDLNDPEAGYFASWMGANSEPRKGFLEVTISEAEMVAEFVGSTATSEFTDSFTIRVMPSGSGY